MGLHVVSVVDVDVEPVTNTHERLLHRGVAAVEFYLDLVVDPQLLLLDLGDGVPVVVLELPGLADEVRRLAVHLVRPAPSVVLDSVVVADCD